MTKLGAGLRSGYAVKCVAIYGRVFRVYFCVALYPVLKYEPRFQASAASVITFNPKLFFNTYPEPRYRSGFLKLYISTALPLYRSTNLLCWISQILQLYRSTTFFFVLKCVTWEIILKTRLNHLVEQIYWKNAVVYRDG